MADARPEDALEREAANWFTRMHSGEADVQTREAFEAWLHGDRRHKIAYREFEQVYRDLDFVAPEAGVNIDELLQRNQVSLVDKLWALVRRPEFAGITAAACLALVSISVFNTGLLGGTQSAPEALAVAEMADFATAIAEIRDVTLEDGSVVTLGPATRIETEFTSERRHIVLLEGEAFFDVVSDPARPFFVTSQDTLVRVVGTQFDVKRSADIVHVAVLEGIVEVLKPSDIAQVVESGDTSSTPRQVLSAGERVSAARRVALPETRQIEQFEPGGWREGRLAYEDASLAEIVADMNRYVETPIRIATSDVGDLRSTLAFRADEMDTVLEVITTIHPVRVERASNGEVVLRRRSDG